MWPVMALENDIGNVPVFNGGFHQVFRPCFCIADFGTTESVKIVQGSRAVFGKPKRFILRDIVVHFGGRFCSRRQLKFDIDTI